MNLTDEQLLKECRFEAFRGPGPGGQKRNKTSSAVRLTHEPTGISVIAGESRSQQQNRSKALKRLRHQIALQVRQTFAADRWEPGQLERSRQSGVYPSALALVLDALWERGWSVSEAAKILGASTGQLIQFLKADEKALVAVNQHRKKEGLRTLI